MPDQSSAADEHALLQEITAPLAALPDDALQVAADVEFPVAFRGYDRLAVDAYVKRTSQLVAELQSTRSPEAAVRRALERVGEQISGILQRAHETAEQITAQSRREAEDRLVRARQEAAEIAAAAERRVKDLDAETDRIWAERHRIVEDARELASQLLGLADEAATRFPPAEDTGSDSTPGRLSAAVFDAEVEDAEEVQEDDTAGQTAARAAPPTTGPPASGPPPPASDAPTPGPEPQADDPDPTAILPRTQDQVRAEREPAALDQSEPAPTTRLPRTDEPEATAEHPRPTPTPPPSPEPPRRPE